MAHPVACCIQCCTPARATSASVLHSQQAATLQQVIAHTTDSTACSCVAVNDSLLPPDVYAAWTRRSTRTQMTVPCSNNVANSKCPTLSVAARELSLVGWSGLNSIDQLGAHRLCTGCRRWPTQSRAQLMAEFGCRRDISTRKPSHARRITLSAPPVISSSRPEHSNKRNAGHAVGVLAGRACVWCSSTAHGSWPAVGVAEIQQWSHDWSHEVGSTLVHV